MRLLFRTPSRHFLGRLQLQTLTIDVAKSLRTSFLFQYHNSLRFTPRGNKIQVWDSSCLFRAELKRQTCCGQRRYSHRLSYFKIWLCWKIRFQKFRNSAKKGILVRECIFQRGGGRSVRGAPGPLRAAGAGTRRAFRAPRSVAPRSVARWRGNGRRTTRPSSGPARLEGRPDALRRRMNRLIKSPPNLERLVLGRIEADFCK